MPQTPARRATIHVASPALCLRRAITPQNPPSQDQKRSLNLVFIAEGYSQQVASCNPCPEVNPRENPIRAGHQFGMRLVGKLPEAGESEVTTARTLSKLP